MAVAIRLARGGAKKKPYYRLVVTDKRRAITGKFIETVGRYGPMLAADDPERFTCDKQRVEYWLKVGAQASKRAQILLAKQGLMKNPPIPKQTKKQLPKKGTLEKIKAKEEAAAKPETTKPDDKKAAEPQTEDSSQSASEEQAKDKLTKKSEEAEKRAEQKPASPPPASPPEVEAKRETEEKPETQSPETKFPETQSPEAKSPEAKSPVPENTSEKK